MIEKTRYTLHCTGSLEAGCLAELLGLFQAECINIRQLTLLPQFDNESIQRMEVQFEIPTTHQELFIEGLQSHLKTLSRIELKHFLATQS